MSMTTPHDPVVVHYVVNSRPLTTVQMPRNTAETLLVHYPNLYPRGTIRSVNEVKPPPLGYLIYTPEKPSRRRLSFINDMTTLEKSLGWVAKPIQLEEL